MRQCFELIVWWLIFSKQENKQQENKRRPNRGKIVKIITIKMWKDEFESWQHNLIAWILHTVT